MGASLRLVVLLAALSTPFLACAQAADKWWITSKQRADANRVKATTNRATPPLLTGPQRTVPSSHALQEDVSRYGYRFAQHGTQHFELLYRDSTLSSKRLQASGDLLERAFSRFYADFRESGFTLRTVNAPLSWMVFDRADHYRDFARMADGMDSPYLESYYSADSNHVVLMQVAASYSRDSAESPAGEHRYVRPGPEVAGMDAQHDRHHESGDGGLLDVRRAVHEVAHQLAFNSGLQKRGVTYPMWVSEGLATNFEADALEDIGVGKWNAPRFRQLMRAMDHDRLMPLEQFVALVQIPADRADSANDLYAQSWGLFNFLLKTRGEQLRTYMTAINCRDDDTRVRSALSNAFTSAFGSPAQLERPWLAYLNAMRDAHGQ